MNHLIVRKDGFLCTRCFQTEPIHVGDGTPMGTIIHAYEIMAKRHSKCIALKAGEKRCLI